MTSATEDRARFDARSEDRPLLRAAAANTAVHTPTSTRAETHWEDDHHFAEGPRHPELYRRLKDSFGPTYLTVLSIIQGVALSALAAVVAREYAHFTLVNWVLVVMTFCVLVVTWNVYTAQSVMWDWIPDLRDSTLPFVVGAVELFLDYTLAASLTVWLLGLAVFAFVGALATQHIGWRAKDEPDNMALLGILAAHHRLFSRFLAADGALLLVLGLISHMTGADAARWGHDGRGLLALCIALVTGVCFSGALYLAHTYLRKAVHYARHGRLPPAHMVHLTRLVHSARRSRSMPEQ